MRRKRNIYPVMPIFRREKSGGNSGVARLPYSDLVRQMNPYPGSAESSPNYWANFGVSPVGVFDMYNGKPPMDDIHGNFVSTFDVVTRHYQTDENNFFDIHSMLSGLCIAPDAVTGEPMTCAVISTYAKIPESSEYFSPLYTIDADSDMVMYGVMDPYHSVTTGLIPYTTEAYQNMPISPAAVETVTHDGIVYNNFYFYDPELIAARTQEIKSPALIYPETIKAACQFDGYLTNARTGVFENDGHGNIRKTGNYEGVAITHRMVHLILPGETSL